MVSNKRKGWFGIAFLVIMTLFAFALINMFVGNSMDSINTMIQDNDELSNSSKAVNDNLNNRYDNIIDGSFALIMLLLLLLCIYVSYNSRDSNLLKVIAIIIMVFIGIAGLLLENVYDGVTEDEGLQSTFSNYTFAHFVLGNFGLVSVVIILTMITFMGLGGSSNV